MTDTMTLQQALDELKFWVRSVQRNMHKPPEERWVPTFEECKEVAEAIDVYFSATRNTTNASKWLYIVQIIERAAAEVRMTFDDTGLHPQ
jgi:hypothetical protein